MNKWKKYPGDRKKLDHPLGFVVIVPKKHDAQIPLYCPVCRMLMKTVDDSQYFRTKGCCEKCGLKWADPNLEKWKSGWRPSTEEVASEVKERQQLPILLNVDALEV